MAFAPPDAETKYMAYTSRFVVLALFSCSTALSAFMWICFSAIFATAQQRYEATTLDINALSMTYMIAYLPGSFIALYVTERYGLRMNLIVAALFNCACALTRYGGNFWQSPRGSFGVVLFGQLLGALGQPLMLNAPARIANDWFPMRERDFATVVMTMANSVGNAAGALLPAYTVSSADDISWMLLYQAVPCVVVLLFMVVFIRDRPTTPPSASAAMQLERRTAGADKAASSSNTQSMSDATNRLWQDFRHLVNNKTFLLLLIGFSIAAGTSWALLTVLAQMISPCGYGDTDAGTAGAVLLGVGVLTALAVGPILERTKGYLLLQKVFMALSLAATVFVLLVNKPGNGVLVIASYAVLGAFLMPVFPISLEHTAECTYPIPADNGAALLMLFANVFSLVLTFVLTPLLQLPSSANCETVLTPAAGVLVLFMLIGVLFVLPMKADYRRLAAEHNHTLTSINPVVLIIPQAQRAQRASIDRALLSSSNSASLSPPSSHR